MLMLGWFNTCSRQSRYQIQVLGMERKNSIGRVLFYNELILNICNFWKLWCKDFLFIFQGAHYIRRVVYYESEMSKFGPYNHTWTVKIKSCLKIIWSLKKVT